MEKPKTRLQNKHKPKNKIKIESQLSSEQKIQKCSNHEKRGSVVGYGGKDTQSATGEVTVVSKSNIPEVDTD